MAEQIMVELSEPVAATIRAAVAAGDYASTGDVIREAVQQWHDERDAFGDVAALRRAWDEGKASGTARPLDMAAIIDEARASHHRV